MKKADNIGQMTIYWSDEVMYNDDSDDIIEVTD